MTIQIPKEMRGFAYYRVLPADLNTIDMDHVLPSLYFKVITGGMDRSRRPNDPTDIQGFLTKIAEHPDLVVEPAPVDERLLDRLIRTSVVSIGSAGRGKTQEKIDVVNDSTLLAFKPGFPTESTSIRHVDRFIYRMLCSRFEPDELRNIFLDSLGKGITFRISSTADAYYDGTTEVDTITRLTMAYLDGLSPTPLPDMTKKASDKKASDATAADAEILPGYAAAFAQDLERFLRVYSTSMPAQALTYHLKAIISINLFAYTVKLIDALPALLAHPDDLPPTMQEEPGTASPPLLYADFTEQKSHRSWEMAVACVQRDLSTIEPFIYSVLYLKQLESYLSALAKGGLSGLLERQYGQPLSGPYLIAAMLQLRDDAKYAPQIRGLAIVAKRRINESIWDSHAPHDEDEEFDPNVDQPEVATIVADTEDPLAEVALLLESAQGVKIQTNITQWFRSVGGLTKPYGLLQGESKGRGRLNWRYQPSNDLLATLVMMAGVDIPEWDDANPRPQPIRLREFLEWLERRFGIIVDRPPEMFSGPEYVAAAQDNRRAMLTRLRQMGIFRDLSDDFTVQRLIPPYADTVRRNDTLEEVHS